MYKFEPLNIMERHGFTSIEEYNDYVTAMREVLTSKVGYIMPLDVLAVYKDRSGDIFVSCGVHSRIQCFYTSHSRTVFHGKVFGAIRINKCVVEEYKDILVVSTDDNIIMIVDNVSQHKVTIEDRDLPDSIRNICQPKSVLVSAMLEHDVFTYDVLLDKFHDLPEQARKHAEVVKLIHEHYYSVSEFGLIFTVNYGRLGTKAEINMSTNEVILEGNIVGKIPADASDSPVSIEYYCGFTSVVVGTTTEINWLDADVKELGDV